MSKHFRNLTSMPIVDLLHTAMWMLIGWKHGSFSTIWNGDAHFFFYNVGGLMDDERHHFKDFIDARLLNITDLISPYIQSLYPSWYYHQLLYINDCLQRARFLANYIFFFDFDEFLQVQWNDFVVGTWNLNLMLLLYI